MRRHAGADRHAVPVETDVLHCRTVRDVVKVSATLPLHHMDPIPADSTTPRTLSGFFDDALRKEQLVLCVGFEDAGQKPPTCTHPWMGLPARVHLLRY